MSGEALIRYDSKSVTNGEPVGTVYVKRGYGRGVYSYTYHVADATRFATMQAAVDELLQHSWPGAMAVGVDIAKDLR